MATLRSQCSAGVSGERLPQRLSVSKKKAVGFSLLHSEHRTIWASLLKVSWLLCLLHHASD